MTTPSESSRYYTPYPFTSWLEKAEILFWDAAITVLLNARQARQWMDRSQCYASSVGLMIGSAIWQIVLWMLAGLFLGLIMGFFSS